MHHWSIEEVETLSTNAIIRKLRDFGVDFRKKQFLVDVKRFYSAEELHLDGCDSLVAKIGSRCG
jgi:hypothetical protein